MKFLNKIFSRVFIIGFIIFIQVVFLLFLMFEFQLAFRIVRVFFILITISQMLFLGLFRVFIDDGACHLLLPVSVFIDDRL